MAIFDHNSNLPSTRAVGESLPAKSAPAVAIILCWGNEYCLLSQAYNAGAAGAKNQVKGPSSSCVLREPASLAQPPLFYRVDSLLDVEHNTKLTPTHMIYRALKAYFDNGGGYCYVVNQNDQAQAVGCLPDVSLIVEAGTWADVAAYVDRSVFVILDSNIIGEVALPTGGASSVGSDRNAQYAFYGPWLKADWTTEVVPPSAAVAGFYGKSERNHGVLESALILDLQGGLAPLFVSSDYNATDSSDHVVVHIIHAVNSSRGLCKKAPICGHRVQAHRGTLLRLWRALKRICGRSSACRYSAPVPPDAATRLQPCAPAERANETQSAREQLARVRKEQNLTYIGGKQRRLF